MAFLLITAGAEGKAKFPDELALEIVSQCKVRVETINLTKGGPTTCFIFEGDYKWVSRDEVVICIWKDDFLLHRED